MTPAEQGQERVWPKPVWVCDNCGDWAEVEPGGTCEVCEEGTIQIVEVVPAAELEMCQRYFPFLQRSRADYKRRYEGAVEDRDKWQRVADGNERGWTACQEELARLRREKR